MQQSFEPDSGAKPQRHRLNLPLDLHPGDVVDFVTHARENHDCDGVYLIDVQVLWLCTAAGLPSGSWQPVCIGAC